MKRYITNRILIFALILTLLCGCAAPDLPTDPTDEPLVSTNPSTEPSEPTTESTSDPTTEPTSEPTDTNPNAGNLLFEPQIEILERTFSYSSECVSCIDVVKSEERCILEKIVRVPLFSTVWSGEPGELDEFSLIRQTARIQVEA